MQPTYYVHMGFLYGNQVRRHEIESHVFGGEMLLLNGDFLS